MKKCLMAIMLLFFVGATQAQERGVKIKKHDLLYYQYDTDLLSPTFFQERRDSLRALMPDSSVAIIFSAPERKRSNNMYYEYHQNPNFYYLTGITEPNSIVLIYKEKQDFGNQKADEVLFVQDRDPKVEIWLGRRMGVKGAKELTTFKEVMNNTDFADFNAKFGDLNRVFFQKPETMEEGDTSKTDNLDGIYQSFEKKDMSLDAKNEKYLQMMMAQLRQIKTPEELVLLRKAIDITCEAQNELMRQINDSMTEYESEALIEYMFKKNGAEYPGFPSIQGSGENSCVLHYNSNRRPFSGGGLLVSDVGAEYHGYSADVTRSIPPNGKYSAEQTLIYNLVLKAQTAGIEAAQVGNSFWAPHKAAQKVIAAGLKELGIIKKESDFKKYFMHGTSHYLGLDVHDVGTYTPLEANNVITVEPGIYIAEDSDCDSKWWNIGVRIEDDILIRKEGPENLSAKSPRTIEKIEKMMQERRK